MARVDSCGEWGASKNPLFPAEVLQMFLLKLGIESDF